MSVKQCRRGRNKSSVGRANFGWRNVVLLTFLASVALSVGCGNGDDGVVETEGAIAFVPPRDVVVVARASKVCQLVGDVDRQREEPTLNLTESRYGIFGTDLGIPFRHDGRTYLLFGDTIGEGQLNRDPIAYTEDETPEDGIELTFFTDESGVYETIEIPGVSLGQFEVPTEGVSVGGTMYVYCTTDHTLEISSTQIRHRMGRCVLAKSIDRREFRHVYDVSTNHFINLSIVEVDSADWAGLPQENEPGLVIFGSGRYRDSDVRLAFQPAAEIESRESLRYFSGLNDRGEPTWSVREEDAEALFDQPCVGEFSVSYNRFIGKWIMLYNCNKAEPRGINLRTADRPWGPWSETQLIFHPWGDAGFCHFIHANWFFQHCDTVHDAGREYTWGSEYGPYQFEHLAIGNGSETTIYFTMSTWNPYTVVLMKATLGLSEVSSDDPHSSASEA